MAENTVKKYYDDSQRQIDEQAIADKFNAATIAQYNVQREQNRQAENQFYNQMYNTQQTAMDTIRKSNAAAVSTGASRGVQAANELSAILGLEQESVAGATELAQANRQTAQEETAAVLENVLKAYQQASQERQNYVQNAIQSASVDVQQDANEVQREATAVERDRLAIEQQQIDATNAQIKQTDNQALQSTLKEGVDAYLTEVANQGKDYATYSEEGLTSLDAVLNKTTSTVSFKGDDWKGSRTASAKGDQVESYIKQICKTYGLNENDYAAQLDKIKSNAREGVSFWSGKEDHANALNRRLNNLLQDMREDYMNKQTAK